MTMTTVETAPRGASDMLSLLASTVTGAAEVPIEVLPHLTAGEVSRSLTSLMSLPTDVAYALRDDGSAAYLDDDQPIGEQVEPGSRVTISPRTHLGG